MHDSNNYLKEQHLPASFCEKKTAEARQLIDTSISFTTVGMPAVGISFFLHYLASNPFGDNYSFIHINIYDLPDKSKSSVYRLFNQQLGNDSTDLDEQALVYQIKKSLQTLTTKHKRVVIIFNRFDQLGKIIDKSFLTTLYQLRELNKEQIVFIFSANRPLIEIFPQIINGTNLFMLSNTLYIPPYNEDDLTHIYQLNMSSKVETLPNYSQALKLAGGHHQLFQLLINSVRFDQPLLDKFILIRLKELFDYLPYRLRLQIQRIAAGKSTENVDPYLLDIGMVIKEKSGIKLFSPLFKEYLLKHSASKLPIKEKRLYKLLLNNLGSVVSKDLIFATIWPDYPEDASDWALNSLIYRLKKHPAFVNEGYIIENQKKEGYILYKD